MNSKLAPATRRIAAFIGGMFHPAAVPVAAGPTRLALFGWFWHSGGSHTRSGR